MSDKTKTLFSMRLQVQWGEMDALGHVNNAEYFNYMQEARIQWLNQIDFDWSGPTSPVIVNAFCEFQREIIFPAELEITVSAGKVGRSSFDTLYTISNLARNGEIAATGSSKVVWIDRNLRKSVALPDNIRSSIEQG